MSFGFSAGDFILGLKICKFVIDAIKDGPKEYRELDGELRAMKITLDNLTKDANDADSLLNRRGTSRKDDLITVISGVDRTMQDLEALVKKHSIMKKNEKGMMRVWSAYKVGSEDLSAIRGKLTFHTSTINLFLTSLGGTTISRMEKILDRIYDRLVQDDVCEDHQSIRTAGSTRSVLSCIDTQPDEVWRLLKEEMQLSDVPLAHLLAYRDDILRYVRQLVDTKGLLEGDGIETYKESLTVGGVDQPGGLQGYSNGRIWIPTIDKSIPHVGQALRSTSENQMFTLAKKSWRVRPLSSLSVHQEAVLTGMRHGLYQGQYSTILVLDLAASGNLTYRGVQIGLQFHSRESDTWILDSSPPTNLRFSRVKAPPHHAVWTESLGSHRRHFRIAVLISYRQDWFHICLGFTVFPDMKKTQDHVQSLHCGLTVEPVKSKRELTRSDLEAYNIE